MFDCIVIGAGAGGLVCTKELLERGLTNIVCLEKNDRIGGIFNHAYDNLVLTSSCTFSMFSDFWMGDGYQHRFWTKAEVLDYWSRYAQHFGVKDKIRFHSQVVEVKLNHDIWQIQLKTGEILEAKKIALAIGNNSVPSYPDWKDSLTSIDYYHSQQYRNNSTFIGQNVLVVGGGESGSDIALEVSKVANKCWICLRQSTGWVVPRQRGEYAADIATHRGIYGLPREYGSYLSHLIFNFESSKDNLLHEEIIKLNRKIKAQNKIWGTYGTKNISLPKAIVNHQCEVVDDISRIENGGKKLITVTGKVLENVDRVIFATGYRNYISFLPEQLQTIEPRHLYKHMFDTRYRDKIVWIGNARPSFGSQFPIMEMQARFFALICSQEKNLPPSEEMQKVISADKNHYRQQFEHNAERIKSLVDYHHYMDDLASLIKCQPPLWRYFWQHPRLWLKMVYGATQATQFRLQGAGKKEQLAREILHKLPISPFNHLVKAGLKLRSIYILQSIMNFFRLPINLLTILENNRRKDFS